MVLKRPYSKLQFPPYLRLMVDERVVQKVQELPEFLSYEDGWPLKLKLLSFFIQLGPNDSHFFADVSIFYRYTFARLRENDLMTSSWRHNIRSSPNFLIWFILSISFLCVSLKSIGSSELKFYTKPYTRIYYQDIWKFWHVTPTDPPLPNRF